MILGPPREDPVLLTHRPQVLSWDRADTWAQQRLVPYRDEIAARLGPTVASLGAVAFDLSIGFGPTSDLEVVGDLDNYLAPVAEALGRDRIVAAWGSKDTGQSSTLAVGSPRNLAPDALADFQHATVRTRSSTATNAWKAEIASQLSHLMPLPSTGAVELVAGFRVGPGRAWLNLWKPAIDALGRILGPGPRQWHPRDGRVTRLGMSVARDAALGWDVEIDYWWRSVPWRDAR